MGVRSLVTLRTTRYLAGTPSATMSSMKRAASIALAVLLAGVASLSRAGAQTGSITFVARARPSAGLEEPIRGFPFYLLKRSYEQIQKDVDAAYPKPDQDAFISKLEVSEQLRAWMKRNHSVSLTGEDFIHKLHVADVMDTPEFYQAYMTRNAGDKSADFPIAKYKASDQKKNPAKYEKDRLEYREAVRKYLAQNPQSMDGIDLELIDIDPAHKWAEIEGRRAPEVHRQTLDLAESKYLVAHTETDIQGMGSLQGITPGTYWLSTLDVPAAVGDARPRWDVAVIVEAGRVTNVMLSNSNAIQPPSVHQ